MRTLASAWASNRLYDAGPKTGELSKIKTKLLSTDAGTLSPNGIQPGSGDRPGAEEMNYLLHVLLKDALRARYAAFGVWEQLGAVAVEAAARTPAQGHTIYSKDDDIGRMSGDGYLTNVVPSAFGTVGRKMAVQAGTHAVIVGEDPGSTGVKAYGYGGTALSPYTSTLVDSEGARACTGIAYDEVANVVIAATYDDNLIAGSNFRPYTVSSAGVLTARSVLQSTNNHANMIGTNCVASGGGTTLIMWIRYSGADTAEFKISKSTNGGVTWAAATPPSFGTAGSAGYPEWDICGFQYIADFMGLGPQFVLAYREPTNDFRIAYSSDGGSWTYIDLPAALASVFDPVGQTSAIILGDLVVLSRDTSPSVYVWDLVTGAVTAHAACDTAIEYMLFDGVHLFVFDGTNIYRSLPIQTPTTITALAVDA